MKGHSLLRSRRHDVCSKDTCGKYKTDDESWYPMAEQITREQQPGRIEDVRGSGIYPATGPHPPGDAIVRTPGALGHPEERHTVHWTNERVEPWILFAGRLIFG